jgi:hypothetical protein
MPLYTTSNAQDMEDWHLKSKSAIDKSTGPRGGQLSEADCMHKLVQSVLSIVNDSKDYFETASTKVHPAFIARSDDCLPQQAYTSDLIFGLVSLLWLLGIFLLITYIRLNIKSDLRI